MPADDEQGSGTGIFFFATLPVLEHLDKSDFLLLRRYSSTRVRPLSFVGSSKRGLPPSPLCNLQNFHAVLVHVSLLKHHYSSSADIRHGPMSD